MREVLWSDKATADYLEAVSYVAALDPDRAVRMLDRIVNAAEGLGQIPTGHPGRVIGAYDKSLQDIRYILVYELDQPMGKVTILHLVHSSRDWPPENWLE